MNTIRIKLITQRRQNTVMWNNTNMTMYYWQAITAESQLMFLRTVDHKQSTKLTYGNYYMLKKFVMKYQKVTVQPETDIFKCAMFTFDDNVVREFFEPAFIGISTISTLEIGTRLSIHGVVTNKATISGPMSTRTEVLVSSMQDNTSIPVFVRCPCSPLTLRHHNHILL